MNQTSGPERPGADNVLFIVVDGLFSHQAGFLGNRASSPTPTLDALSKNSTVFENVYAVGSPTQFAMPGLLNSRMPLDDGGYEYGMRDRETSLAAEFHAAGFDTAGFAAVFWLDFLYGYDRGFDRYSTFYDIEQFAINLRSVYLRHYRGLISDRALSREDAVRDFCPFLLDYLEALEALTDRREVELRRATMPFSPRLHMWRFSALARFARDLAQDIRHDANGRIVAEILSGEFDLPEEIVRFRKRMFRPRMLARLASETLKNTACSAFLAAAKRDVSYLKLGALYLVNLLRKQTKVASAGYIVEEVRTWLGSRQRDQPFFAFVHVMDVHDENYISHDRAARGAEAMAEVEELGRCLGGADRGVEYDLSLNYVDQQIGALVEDLARLELLERTLIVVTSDHGSGAAFGRKPRDFKLFNDVEYRCPFVLYRAGGEGSRCAGLLSALDVAPTVLDAAGLGTPTSFKGASRLGCSPRSSSREFVVMEHLGRGPCDSVNKSLRLCVTDSVIKVVCTGNLHLDEELTLAGVYRIVDFREEEIVGAEPELYGPLLAVAIERFEELRRDPLLRRDESGLRSAPRAPMGR